MLQHLHAGGMHVLCWITTLSTKDFLQFLARSRAWTPPMSPDRGVPLPVELLQKHPQDVPARPLAIIQPTYIVD